MRPPRETGGPAACAPLGPERSSRWALLEALLEAVGTAGSPANTRPAAQRTQAVSLVCSLYHVHGRGPGLVGGGGWTRRRQNLVGCFS